MLAAYRSLEHTMKWFASGDLKPIPVDRVFDASEVQDAFRYMQQGKHIGKIVVEIRSEDGKLLAKDVDATKQYRTELDRNGSYLLIGGLGGLGRSLAVWMVEHGAKALTFLSRSAGRGKHDDDFAREIEAMGCSVQLVQGDVSNTEDVTRAVDGVQQPLKGIIQMSMVLRDQMFEGMTLADWNAVTQPKVEGTWNLHHATQSRQLDFFVLFSSLSGIVGQVGQANYASANTFLDAFAQYRTSLGLACTAIDLGAMEDIGYLSENTELLKKMQGTGWNPVRETELVAALDLAMMPPQQRKSQAGSGNSFLLGLAPSIPLSSPDSNSRQRRDVRMAVYHNGDSDGANNASSSDDGLRTLMAAVRKDPSRLGAPETATTFALEIGKKLCSLVLAGDVDIDVATRTSDMGLDSLVALELQAWWKVNFGFDISTLDMLSMGTLEALGKRAASGLAALLA